MLRNARNYSDVNKTFKLNKSFSLLGFVDGENYYKKNGFATRFPGKLHDIR